MMRVALLAPAVGAAVATVEAQTTALERAAWLAGCWELRSGGRATMEMWMPPTGNVMLGASRTVVNGRMSEFEYLRIRAAGDTLIYTAIPSGQTQTDFRMVGGAASPLVFENRAHDFPQVIIYRRLSADSLVARVEGPGPNNTTRGFDLRMRKASCTDPLPAPPPDTTVMDAVFSRDRSRLAVVKGALPNLDLYVVDPDGSTTRRLTDHSAVDYQPSWSPDGSRIAFVSARDGHQEIYTVRPDGSDLTQLTRGTAHTSEPAWSPDGRSIAFRSERDGGPTRPHVYVMNADGSAPRALTRDSTGGASPAWSPDGKLIAFNSNRSGRNEIYLMNADGSGQRQLSMATQGSSGLPTWSPSGAMIAFWTTRDGNDEVYVMNADGSGARNVSNNPARDLVLGWTPDGTHIIFRSNRDRGGFDVYRMRPDGSDVTRVTITR